MQKVAFFHVATMGHYEEVNREILECMRDTGLLDTVDFLHICWLGENPLNLPFEHPKFKIEFIDTRLDLYEYPTMDTMYQYCKNNDCYALYFANVGVSHKKDRDDYYPGWRHLDMHILIKDHLKCIAALDEGYDAASFEWQTDPSPHFSGACFWIRADFARQLPALLPNAKEYGLKVLNSHRHGTEMWIGMDKQVKYKSFFQTGYSWRNRPTINWYEEFVKQEGINDTVI